MHFAFTPLDAGSFFSRVQPSTGTHGPFPSSKMNRLCPFLPMGSTNCSANCCPLSLQGSMAWQRQASGFFPLTEQGYADRSSGTSVRRWPHGNPLNSAAPEKRPVTLFMRPMLTRALALIAETAPMEGEAYNIGSGKQVSVAELANMIRGMLGFKDQPHFDGIVPRGNPLHWQADITRIKSLGFSPQDRTGRGHQELCELVPRGIGRDMKEVLHIGLIMRYGREWVGGTEYIKNIILALASLPEETRSKFKVSLICGESVNPSYYNQVVPHLENVYHLDLEKMLESRDRAPNTTGSISTKGRIPSPLTGRISLLTRF